MMLLKFQTQNMIKLKKRLLELEKKYPYLKKKIYRRNCGAPPSINLKKLNICVQCFLYQMHLIKGYGRFFKKN